MQIKDNPVILTVDDDSTVRISIKNYLEDYGFRLFQAVDGEECLKTVKENEIDLVLLDLKMPGMDGLEVLSQIKKDYPDLPVIVISGTGEIDDVVQALRNGAQNFLQKPINNMEMLTFAVNSALEKARLKKENSNYQNHLEELVDKKVNELNITYEKLISEMSKRASTQGKLEESEVQLESILSTVPDIVYRLDQDGNFLFVNDAIIRYGYDPSELIGKSVLNIVHQDDWPKLTQRIEKRKKGESLVPSMEIKFHAKDRSVHVFQIHIALITSKGKSIPVFKQYEIEKYDDEIVATQGIALDITERVNAEHALRESEEKYRTIIENSHSGILLVDEKFEIILANPKLSEILDRPVSRIIGEDFRKFVSPDSLALVVNNYKLRQENNEAAEKIYEFYVVRENGEKRLVEIYSEVIKSDNEKSITIAQILDITDQKIAQQELRLSEKRFRLLFEEAPYGIFVRDDQKLLMVNPEFSNLFEYSLEELTERDFDLSILFIEELDSERKESSKTFKSTFGTGTTKNNNKIELEIKQDQIDWGGRKAILGFIRDLTEQKKLEEQYQQAQKMEAIGRLAGGIAHDFNNLLTVISGNADLVMMSMPEEDPLYKDVEEIVSTTERASNLTRQLLAFSRKQNVKPQFIEFGSLIGSLKNMLNRIIGVGIQLNTAISEEELWVNADQSQLEQIIVNIVVNARDAMPSGGEIIISAEKVEKEKINITDKSGLFHEKYVRLSIQDSGIGMSQEVKNHIFEPFFTTKDISSGTGLGLATVFGIVKHAKGKIEVKSEEGKGTRFTIYLPFSVKNNSSLEETQKINNELYGDETILVVEDDKTLLNTIEKSLSRFGYKTTTASSAEIALEKIRDKKEEIDLFISDIILEGMNGREFVDIVRVNNPKIKVLFMSGYSENIVDSTENSHTDYIAKPFNMNSLLRKVRSCLKNN